MMTDDYSPRYVGDTSHPLEHTFVDGQGKPHDLGGVSAAAMALVMKNRDTGERKIGAGTWTIGPLDPTDLAPAGKAVYHWSVGDVNAGGIWDTQASVPFSDGPLHFEVKEILFKIPL